MLNMPRASRRLAVSLGYPFPQKATHDMTTCVFAIPIDGSPPFLMLLAEMSDEHVHRDAVAMTFAASAR